MADRATGPVKPPVIDLTARTASRSEAEPRPSMDAPRSRNRLLPDNWPLLTGIAAGGAILGTILTYIVASLLPLPTRLPALPPDLSAAVAVQDARLGTLESGLGDLKSQAGKTEASLDATISKLDGNAASLDKTIADLKASIPAPSAPVDLAPLETEIRTLKSEIDAIEAGAPATDASAIAKSLTDLETSLDGLTTRLGGVDATLASLRTDLDAARKTLNDHINASLPNEAGPALKLPLILSGLDSAFATGKPFQAELDTLATVLPDLTPPDALKAVASIGLSRPDTLMTTFEADLPTILATRGTTGGDWVQNTTDWLKSLLALRPAEEVAGDSPDAIVSRLEGAMSRRDYAAAIGLIGQLPVPMQQAAASIEADIAAHAAADQFVADLRAKALGAAGPTP